MAAPTGYRPWRILGLLAVLLISLTVWAFWPGQAHTPQLGLDLRGGTQVILDPQPITEGATITEEQLQQSVEIIRQRVNGIGVAEADVSIQGSGNDAVLVVSVPGVTQDRIVELVGRTALLNFRPVNNILNPAPVDPNAQNDGSGQNNSQNQDQTQGKNKDKQTSSNNQTDTASGNAEVPQGEGQQIVQADSDDAKFQQELLALDCTLPENQGGGAADDPAKWLGTCANDGSAKYSLEPAFIKGTDIASAQAQLPQQGAGGWVVTLDFNGEGASKLAEISKKLSAQPPPTNQFAIVLDGVVVSAPSFREPILGGQAQIEGNFTAEEANDLANVLKFGALPVTLEQQSVESVSPTLGNDQLRAGILAGAMGLILVGLYLILYYRVLGVVAVLSLVIAAWVTYCLFVVLGNTIGFTLTLAGIAGAIVSIGITADSFIVYFERLRDEIRDGKSLRRAADDGWIRARRTLLAADFVSILAAIVLYFLSVGNVRGFAFALGMTTVVDVIISFWFTRPVAHLMANTKWMQKGGAFTGVSPKRLGVESLQGVRREPTRRKKAKPKVTTGVSGSGPDDGAVI
ncbi:MAG: protein translocase subunit SecD [Candidatus Nanopelagicales bacterium]